MYSLGLPSCCMKTAVRQNRQLFCRKGSSIGEMPEKIVLEEKLKKIETRRFCLGGKARRAVAAAAG